MSLEMYKFYNLCLENNKGADVGVLSAYFLFCDLIKNPECTKTYSDDNCRIIRQTRLSFNLSIL